MSTPGAPHDPQAPSFRAELLTVPLDQGDVTATVATVGDYLKAHRPLTDRWPLYVALVNACYVPGVTVDQDGEFESFPEAAQKRADALIDAAAKALEVP